jgi:hypothetical protein
MLVSGSTDYSTLKMEVLVDIDIALRFIPEDGNTQKFISFYSLVLIISHIFSVSDYVSPSDNNDY